MFVCSYVVFSYWALAHGCGFDPQIKVKARLTNSELGDRGGLYMWASYMGISKCCDVCWVLYLVVRRHVLCHTGYTKFPNFYYVWIFKLKGYPVFEHF